MPTVVARPAADCDQTKQVPLPPMAEAAACASLIKATFVGLLGLMIMAKRAARGSGSCRRPIGFPPSSPLMEVMPLTLLPGRFMLATSPSWTGSAPMPKTIGIVAVAALAATWPACLRLNVSRRPNHSEGRSML
jgi:hypothetical protein